MTGKSLRDELIALGKRWRELAREARHTGRYGEGVADAREWDADDLDRVLASPQGEGWRDIESAPKDGTPVLLVGSTWRGRKEGGAPTMAVGRWTSYRDSGWWRGVSYPTHWMPLPSSPEIPKAERQETRR